jgi:protease-4
MNESPAKPRRSGMGCFVGFLIFFLLISLGVNALLFIYAAAKGSSSLSGSETSTTMNYFTETLVEKGSTADKIAVIQLRGMISYDAPGEGGNSMVVEIVEQLRHAAEDPKTKAIVLYIDSPGGEVTASDVIYNEVRRIKSEVKKPVVVYMGSLTASGGYYIAVGGNHLMANETTLTGSIGVIIQTINYRELFGKVGLEAMTFKSGAFKDMLSGSREMTPAERDYVNGLVMQMYDKFVGIVARERGLNEAKLRTTWADGRIISAPDAKTAGLIDSTGYLEDAYNQARSLAGAPGAKVVRYESQFNLARALRIFGESQHANRSVKVELGDGIIPKLKPGYCYYLWMPSSDIGQ